MSLTQFLIEPFKIFVACGAFRLFAAYYKISDWITVQGVGGRCGRRVQGRRMLKELRPSQRQIKINFE